MKILRHIAILLLILSGILYSFLFVSEPLEQNFQWLLVFGIFYFAISTLMLLNREFSAAWGIIFSLIALGAGLFETALHNWSPIFGGLFILDAGILICCSVLFFTKKRNY